MNCPQSTRGSSYKYLERKGCQRALVRITHRHLKCFVPLTETFLVWDGRRTLADGRDALIALRDSTLHAEMRGPWNKSFGAEPMKNYEEQLIRRIIEFNSRLKEVCAKGTAQVDIAKWIGCFT